MSKGTVNRTGQIMGATQKKKRKIHVNGRDFYWTARTMNDFITQYVTIMTPDKRFFAWYKLPNTNHSIPEDSRNLGMIRIESANIPELSHIQTGIWIDTPDWSEFQDYALPSMIRRVIVYIFETLM